MPPSRRQQTERMKSALNALKLRFVATDAFVSKSKLSAALIQKSPAALRVMERIGCVARLLRGSELDAFLSLNEIHFPSWKSARPMRVPIHTAPLESLLRERTVSSVPAGKGSFRHCCF